MNEPKSITCSALANNLTLTADGEPPNEIQWMAPGEHMIRPLINGTPAEKPYKQRVTAEMASRVNSDLQRMWAAARAGNGDEPYLDFNHKDEERSAEPLEAWWGGEDEKTGGIRMRVKWTASASQAIKERRVRKVSPQWEMDPDTFEFSHVTENLGGLVIRSAFTKNAPVMASAATTTNKKPMSLEELNAAVAAALKPVTDRLDKLEKPATAQAAATTAITTADPNAAITAAVQAAMKPFTERMEKMDERTTTAAAMAKIQPHIDRGAIPPADEKTVKMWTNMVIADEATACAQMAKLPGLRRGTLTTATAGNSAALATSGMEPDQQFIAKAREYGKTRNCKTDKESITAFAATSEGRDLYAQTCGFENAASWQSKVKTAAAAAQRN
ncbi:MAG TPA: phage protease [Verrucomicrobiae bacterium]|jgi:hypothetical protein|nr:phage protease [Verrucomicrobiae bacterium]